MTIADDLRAALAAADDAYLTGLSNKGTVNRAKKDLEKLKPTAEAAGEMVVVTMGEETCILRAPLGGSMCSCPSSSMCRHRIGAMLWLRDQAGAPPAPPKPEFESLKAYPAEKLAKQLGQRRLAALLFRHRSGKRPYITEDSVVRVELPWLPAVVRLLEPMEHSTCSCHSKSFCAHKAEALLCWQLDRGLVKPEELEEKPDEGGPDPEQTRGVCAAVCQMLSEQLVTGLSRMPLSTRDTVERMASLSHTAGLPSLERALRNLHGEYAAYFDHSATFREGALLERLSRAWRLAAAMEAAGAEELRRLAGTFRDEYVQTGDLKLYLLGLQEYVGRSGYGGTIYYFFERETHEFYTFRDLRPDYYDTKRRSPDAAPWDLPCTLRKAWNGVIDLSGPRVNGSGNLSATKECRSVFLGRAKPGTVIPGDRVCTDFESLLERSAPGRRELERLVLLRPEKWELQPYDTVSQTYSMRLFDRAGRDIWLEVRYETKEAPVIQMLETLEKQLRKGCGLPVFFGEVYRDGDKLKLYPIEYYTDWGDST